jgi:cytochrome c-type biogenesis protein CcmH/NrfG
VERKRFVLGSVMAFGLGAVLVVFLLQSGKTDLRGPGAANQVEPSRKFAGQVAAFEEKVKEDPGNAGYRKTLGDLYIRRGEWPKARAQYAKAVELQPGAVDLRIRLAMTYWHGGEQARGLAQLDEAIRLDPTQVDAHFYKAVLLAGQTDQRMEAAAEFRKVIEIAPESTYARQARAELEKMGNTGADSTADPGREAPQAPPVEANPPSTGQ